MSASTPTDGPKAQPQRLTLEEKLWFDRRKNELQQYGGFGAAVGAATGAAVTCAFRFVSTPLVVPLARSRRRSNALPAR